MPKKRFNRLSRVLHYWTSSIVALSLSIVLVSGMLLLLKKDVEWIQPSTVRGEQTGISLTFEEVLAIAQSVPEAGIESWSDIDRVDARPNKGMLKVRAENRWEIQIDGNGGAILQVAYRRSDLIESIHDGSFFGEPVKLWLFLPIALLVSGLLVTGMIMFFLPYLVKARKKRQ